jgi:hypothetical protein
MHRPRPSFQASSRNTALGPFESLVATLSTRRDGRRVAAIVRVKNTPDGLRRMACLEWGEHRTIAVDELLRAIAKRDGG